MTPHALPRTPRTAPAHARWRRAVAMLTSVTLGVALLAGCGVRLEQPAQVEPTPDASEVVRRAAVGDALALADLARRTLVESSPAAKVGPLLEEVAAAAEAHVTSLGGVYASGLPADPAAPSGSPAAAPAGAATPEGVVRMLLSASAAAAGAADAVESGATARLLTSIAAARAVSADALVKTARLDPAAFADAPSPGRTVGVPETRPPGVPGPTLTALVAAEDQAGYGFEVVAATLTERRRTDALVRAIAHRGRADAWATTAGLADGTDPRQAVYALPPALAGAAADGDARAKAARAAARQMEASLAQAYATLVAETDANERAAAIDLTVEAALAAAAWGHERTPFPALAEQSRS